MINIYEFIDEDTHHVNSLDAFSDEFRNKCGWLFRSVGCFTQTDYTIKSSIFCDITLLKYEYTYEGNIVWPGSYMLLYSLPTNTENSFVWIKCPSSIFDISEPVDDNYCFYTYGFLTFCDELPIIEKWVNTYREYCIHNNCHIINHDIQYFKNIPPDYEQNAYISWYDHGSITCYFSNNTSKYMNITMQVGVQHTMARWQDSMNVTIQNVDINNSTDKHEFYFHTNYNYDFNVPFEPNHKDIYNIEIPLNENSIYLESRDDITDDNNSLVLFVTYNNQCGAGKSLIIG